MQQSLELKGMQIYINLGCSDEERAHKQLIELDMELSFLKSFDVSSTDDINQTVCYYTLRNKIQTFCNEISCNLIEYLGKKIYKLISSENRTSITYLKLIKYPPMSQMKTASFIIRG